MAERGETIDDFKRSFAYGARTDLAFKFLEKLPDSDVAEFVRSLLEKLGETIDDGDASRLVEHAYQWQVRGYTPAEGAARTWTYEEGPFAPMAKAGAAATIGLLTSSGHFAAGDDPAPFGVADMSQSEAVARISEFLRTAPQLSEIPLATPGGDLRVRHGGYDVRGAATDPNVAFPLARLAELAAAGVIGAAADPAYSFVGAASQRRILADSAPRWAALLGERGVDAVVLVPV